MDKTFTTDNNKLTKITPFSDMVDYWSLGWPQNMVAEMLKPISQSSVSVKQSQALVFINPLYSDGFSHTDSNNKDGIVHYISYRVTVRNFQIIMNFSP